MTRISTTWNHQLHFNESKKSLKPKTLSSTLLYQPIKELKSLIMSSPTYKRTNWSPQTFYHVQLLVTMCINEHPYVTNIPRIKFQTRTKYIRSISKNTWTILTLEAPIPQNGQTHSNNSSAIYGRIVWVCLTILWNWRKGLKHYH